MVRRNIAIGVCYIMLILLLAGCGSTATDQKKDSGSIPTSIPDNSDSIVVDQEMDFSSVDIAVPDSPDSYRCEIPKLNGSISVPNGYYVFGEDIPYTDEMCRAIGSELEKMKTAISFMQGSTVIAPANDPNFSIFLKVKEKKYDDITLSALSDAEYRLFAATVASGFGVNEFDTIEGNGLRFFAFLYENQGNICRYATVLNGHMVYVYANTGSEPITREQRSVLEYIALSIQYDL